MKKNFLYVSFFAAAFLVSCKSDQAEEAPVEDVVREEVVEEVIEEPVQTETPAAETKTEENKPAKKDEKPVVLKTEEQTKTSVGAKEMKQTKELTKSVEEVKTEGRKPGVVKAKEDAAGGN